ncbi:unnamed protein product [Moneuplotes crassus]|uniref:Adenylate kinase n=1 Tax=Euplotes crassus TaxID=5936 RepID=A0AAD1UIS0_EUPCR|nr:unnamed protein product [Moneuplotes crassus]
MCTFSWAISFVRLLCFMSILVSRILWGCNYTFRKESLNNVIGDLLREEQTTDPEDSKLINDHIKEGKIVPVEITCRLLLKTMQKIGMNKRFLIDGFPRNEDNLFGCQKDTEDFANVNQVIFFELPGKDMLKESYIKLRLEEEQLIMLKQFERDLLL